MKAVIQRVLSASVRVANKKISEIGEGLLILLGIAHHDVTDDVDYLVKKTSSMRIFKDDEHNMNLSVQDVDREILVVSQFTLCADTQRGCRPSFVNAAEPRIAENMYNDFCQKLQLLNIPVLKGQFGAHMSVNLTNDGPVTIFLDSRGHT
jgi:D-tyrosyl-tRNA(Tyr) deacylase